MLAKVPARHKLAGSVSPKRFRRKNEASRPLGSCEPYRVVEFVSSKLKRRPHAQIAPRKTLSFRGAKRRANGHCNNVSLPPSRHSHSHSPSPSEHPGRSVRSSVCPSVCLPVCVQGFAVCSRRDMYDKRVTIKESVCGMYV